MNIEKKKNIEHALKYAPYNTSFSSIYFWKGIILRNLEETDSAICYLSKAKINADIYAKASIYQTLYEIDKKRKKYEQAILYNDTALVYYDSIQKMVHHTEINSLIKKHSTEMYEQRVESQYQKDKAVLIICILLTISFAIFILMYISNRNKIKYIYLQQLLMKNQTEKAVLKEEIKKRRYNNSDLLKALLEFILKIKIDKLEIKKTELLSGNVNIKDKRVDAIVHTGNKKIEIEINSQNKNYLHTRSTAYICNIYQSNASVGDTYYEDTDILQVNLTWGLGKNNDEMKIYKIMNEKGELYVKNFIIYEINMDYYDKIWYSKNEDEIKKNQYMIMLDLDKKELKSMPKDKIVDKYITNVTIVNDDPEFQKYMSEEEDKKKIQNSLLSEAKEEGISQEKISIAKNMLNKNMSIEDISDITGLSIEEINKLPNQ